MIWIGIVIGLVLGVFLATWGFLSIPRVAARILSTPPKDRR